MSAAAAAAGAADSAAEDPDFPPESVQVPIIAEIRWTTLNKALDREESTIGHANPKSSRSSPKPKSVSQRFAASGAIKPNGRIIGLPSKIQQSGFTGNGSRRPMTVRIFPRKIAGDCGGRKPGVPEREPGSPKVSCFGNVSSERDREIYRRRSREEMEENRAGCWASLAAIVRYGGGLPAVADVTQDDDSTADRLSEDFVNGCKNPVVMSPSPPPEKPVMKRFSSGRRPDSWIDDVDGGNNGRVASLHPLDREGILWWK
ncbi:hypothetical protein AXF42_Ash013176 [Apostasia shenzhenica]|uniref:Uncharacterized protein n=1 Tax=Apostasia shenzhenica TaxID=1088818 RepID=A0A2I0BD80_9ASPA|nr:hypothetical protein AXF42_Ash013176 [Apostasia shenzhenica]